MKHLWLLSLLWASLWLGGSFWVARQLQAEVRQAAVARLAEAGEPLQNIHPAAAGLSIVLTGKANHQGDVDRALKLMREEVKLPVLCGRTERFNPVRQVTSEITLEVRPEGWGVLAATPSGVHVRGTAGSDTEANRIGLAVRSAGQLGRNFASDLAADGEVFLESDHLETTIQSTPALTDDLMKQGFLAVTLWGREWQVLDVTKPAETLRRRIQDLGLPAEAWDTDLFAEVLRVQEARTTYLKIEQEKQRQASLAPGHVVMALRGDEMLLRGELGTELACRLLADAVRGAGRDRTVVDQLSHSSHRKPDETSRLLATSLPPLPGGQLARFLAVGTPSSGWKIINLSTVEVEDPGTLSQAMLPSGLDLRLVLPDVITALNWVHSVGNAPTLHQAASCPAYFMITAVGPHVYLRGAVADEAARTQIEAAARRVYATRELDIDVRLSTTCKPMGQALQTLATMPPPPPSDSAGYIAFAFAGDVWRSKPAQAQLLEPAGLQQSGLLPDGVCAALLMPDVLAVAPAVKAQLARLALNPPAPSLQPVRHP